MGKQPWLKWFPSDWRGDPKVRLCSWEAGRLWFEMICFMHEGEPLGYLRIEGRVLGAAELSALLGPPVRKVATWLDELERNGVFSRDEHGCIYSRKMVRDEATRTARATGGRKSVDNPKVPRPKDTLKDTLAPILKGPPQIPDTIFQKPEETDNSSSVSTKPADAPVENPFAYLMPILRKYGYDTDDHEGSIIKALLKKGVKVDDIEAAVMGLAYLRDAGKLNGFGLGPDDSLSMRMLYARSEGKRPLWREAEAEYYRVQPTKKRDMWPKGQVRVVVA